jgi:hypothetical protein
MSLNRKLVPEEALSGRSGLWTERGSFPIKTAFYDNRPEENRYSSLSRPHNSIFTLLSSYIPVGTGHGSGKLIKYILRKNPMSG